jgi:polyhydroxyalkanoate synthesis regulator phasin
MTFDYESATAREIIDHICEDGKVTLDEVTALDKLLNEDWVISRDEAELLFQINSQVGGDQVSQWQELFVSAISRFVVFDLVTPGEIDADEANWLIKQLSVHPTLTEIEHALLAEITAHATSVHPSLEELMKDAGPQ